MPGVRVPHRAQKRFIVFKKYALQHIRSLKSGVRVKQFTLTALTAHMKTEKENQFIEKKVINSEIETRKYESSSDIDDFYKENETARELALKLIDLGEAFEEPILDSDGKEIGVNIKLKKDNSIIYHQDIIKGPRNKLN
jgi:hypothetical protein